MWNLINNRSSSIDFVFIRKQSLYQVSFANHTPQFAHPNNPLLQTQIFPYIQDTQPTTQSIFLPNQIAYCFPTGLSGAVSFERCFLVFELFLCLCRLDKCFPWILKHFPLVVLNFENVKPQETSLKRRPTCSNLIPMQTEAIKIAWKKV